MKKLIVAILSLLFIPSIYAKGSSVTMEPILEAAGPLVEYLETELEQEIVRMEFDIITSSKSTYRSLSKGWTYGILAFGDYRIKDIDIKVYKWQNNEWQLVQKDNATDSSALVYFQPDYDGEYKFTITAYSFEQGYNVGHYGLIVFHE